MKKLWAVVVVTSVLLVALPVSAQTSEGRPSGWGVGLGSGTGVSGVSLKNHSGNRTIQGVIGCSSAWGYRWGHRRYRRSNGCAGIGISGDLLFNQPIITEEGVLTLAWNLGGGGAVGMGRHYRYHGDEIWLGGQFVAGLEFLFLEVPLDVVLEWRPSLFIPDARFALGHAGIHIRYYFQ